MKLKLAIILGLFIAAGLPDIAAACSCFWRDPPDALADSAAVFSGRVLAAHPVSIQGSPLFGLAWQNLETRYEVQVDRVWKGAWGMPAIVDVYSGESSFGCGISMAVGQEYLIYVYSGSSRLSGSFFEPASWPELARDIVDNPDEYFTTVTDSKLRTDSCSRTMLLVHANEDLSFLGPGSTPKGRQLRTLALTSLAALSAVVIVAWRWRRGRGAIPE